MTVIIAIDVLRQGDAATGYLNAAIGVGGVIGAVVSGALVLRPTPGSAAWWRAGWFRHGSDRHSARRQPAARAHRHDRRRRRQPADGGGRHHPLPAHRARRDPRPGATGSCTQRRRVLRGRVAPATAHGRPVWRRGRRSSAPACDGDRRRRRCGPARSRLPSSGRSSTRAGAARRRTRPPGLPPARLEAAASARHSWPTSGPASRSSGRATPADRFYVIAEGTVAVTPGGRTARRWSCGTWGSGEVFGEIGLLSGVPRTATVTAVDRHDACVARRPAVPGAGRRRARPLDRGSSSSTVARWVTDDRRPPTAPSSRSSSLRRSRSSPSARDDAMDEIVRRLTDSAAIGAAR